MGRIEIEISDGCMCFGECTTAENLITEQQQILDASPPTQSSVIRVLCEPSRYDKEKRRISVATVSNLQYTGERKMTVPVRKLVECPPNRSSG